MTPARRPQPFTFVPFDAGFYAYAGEGALCHGQDYVDFDPPAPHYAAVGALEPARMPPLTPVARAARCALEPAE